MKKLLWKIIEESKGDRAVINSQKQYYNLNLILSRYDKETIDTLKLLWNQKVKELKNDEFEKLHFEKGGIVNAGDDGFYTDFANWVVAQGEELFDSFIKNGHTAIFDYIKAYQVPEEEYTFECMSYVFNDRKEVEQKAKDYSVIDRKEIEDIIMVMENERIKLNQQIITAQQGKVESLISLYRGQYYSTGVAIEKLKELLVIPFEDIVSGVKSGIFNVSVVVSQLLKEYQTSDKIENPETLAEILIALWKGETIDSYSFNNFNQLKEKIISGQKNFWDMKHEYNIPIELCQKIVGSWTDQYDELERIIDPQKVIYCSDCKIEEVVTLSKGNNCPFCGGSNVETR